MDELLDPVTWHDRSGTVTTGGVAQVAAPAWSQRRGFSLQNLSAGDLWLSAVGTAVAGRPSLLIPAGALYESPTYGTPSSALSIFGATTGQAFSLIEY